MRRTTTLMALGIIALAGVLPAQVAVGDKAPLVDAKELLNTKIKDLGKLKGRLILYDFFAHW